VKPYVLRTDIVFLPNLERRRDAENKANLRIGSGV
jgi:hypothetical protein